jgi:hypothetical protein
MAIQEFEKGRSLKQAALLAGYSPLNLDQKNYESELRAMDVRIRASRRAGELIAEGQKNGTIASAGQPRKVLSSQTTILSGKKKPKTLDQLGISRDQSSHWKELAGIPEEEFEEQLPMATHQRTSPKKIIKNGRPSILLLYSSAMTSEKGSSNWMAEWRFLAALPE